MIAEFNCPTVAIRHMQVSMAFNMRAPEPLVLFVLAGRYQHGMDVMMSMRQGLVPDWEVEVVDATAAEDDQDMLFFTIFRP